MIEIFSTALNSILFSCFILGISEYLLLNGFNRNYVYLDIEFKISFGALPKFGLYGSKLGYHLSVDSIMVATLDSFPSYNSFSAIRNEGSTVLLLRFASGAELL